MQNPIYLNCAASSFPKPEAVLQCAKHALYQIPDETGRSNGEGFTSEYCRAALAALLNCSKETIFFSSGATESANLIIAGLPMTGTHVLATATEHNSILRPLYNHPDHPEISIIPCDHRGAISLTDLEAMIHSNTRYLFVNHCSNVTGFVQDLHTIGAIAKKHGIVFIVDASQSVGCIPINVMQDQIDILLFTGHKNLFGLSGTGGYYIRSGMSVRIVKTGGTGTDSLWLQLPDYPVSREPGTQNVVGLAALEAGAVFVQEYGIDRIQSQLNRKREFLINGLRSIPGVHVFNTESIPLSGPVVSFLCCGLAPQDVGYILKESYRITVRTGHHCCPCIHDYLGSPVGTVRVSFSVLTEDAHLEAFLQAIREIAEGVHGNEN